MGELKQFTVVEPFTDNDGVVHEKGEMLDLTAEQAEALAEKVEATASDAPSDPIVDQPPTAEPSVGPVTQDTLDKVQEANKEKPWAGNHKI